MATVTSNLHISDSDRPSLRLFGVGEGRYALTLDARHPGSNELNVFATLDQLAALARSLDRLVILEEADLAAQVYSITPEGEAALEDSILRAELPQVPALRGWEVS